MKTAGEYLESLRDRQLVLYVDGKRVADPVEEPKIRPSINAVAMSYALAHLPKYEALATAKSALTGERINRFTHLFRSPEDLVAKLDLQRVLGRLTGTCFQRCVGLDALNALEIASFEAGPEMHARFRRWLLGVQSRDEVVCGAMTDPKGDRKKRPIEQPEQFLRVVERREDGVVIQGVKLHQTGAANSHQIVVMPGQGLRAGEEDFAIAAGMPVDTPGISMILGKQPSDERKGTADAGNLYFGGQEAVVVFDRVFVPWDRVFLDGHLEACGALLEAFAGYHRASYGGCKPGNLDVLTGAATALTRETGVDRAPGVRDKLVEMVYLAESIHGLGLAASHKSQRHPSGQWMVDPILANVCKQSVTKLPYEAGRIAEDLAGGLVATLPSLEVLSCETLGPVVKASMGSERRGRLLRLVEYMTYGAGAVPLRIECMHGAGSPKAQRIVLERRTRWDDYVKLACSLAGVSEDEVIASVAELPESQMRGRHAGDDVQAGSPAAK